MAGWQLDNGYFLDFADEAEISFEIEDDGLVFTSFSGLFSDREMVAEFELDWLFTYSVSLDLMPYFPSKYRTSSIHIDFVDEMEVQVGDWITKVRDIVNLVNTNTVSDLTYIRHLGSLIGVDFPPEDTTSLAEMKKTLIHAVEWYKIKGTYESTLVLGLILGFTLNIYDMYTNDYSAFVLVDEWFVGDEDENPVGFDSSYYKSPHFGVEVVLNKTYLSGSVLYLWTTDKLDNLLERIEDTRPAHTVPHYLLRLNPRTDEFVNVITVTGQIRCRVTSDWVFSQLFFDDTNSSTMWNFDDGSFFDQNATAAIQSINKWVLGTGSYLNDLSDPTWDVESPAIQGTISVDNIEITEDEVIFDFLVPKATEQDDISELGLYIDNTLMVAATFPNIDKDSRVELRIVVEVSKTALV